jgi:hypothetical protein
LVEWVTGQFCGYPGSRHDKELAEKALRREIKVKLTPVYRQQKETPSSPIRLGCV